MAPPEWPTPANPGRFARKRTLPWAARFAPSIAQAGRDVYLSWVDPGTGAIAVSRTTGFSDLSAPGNPVMLPLRSGTPTALAAGETVVLLAWLDPDTHEPGIARAERGGSWDRLPGPGASSGCAPALACFRGRFWLLFHDTRAACLRLLSSPDGAEWREAERLQAESAVRLSLVSAADALIAAWTTPDGTLWQHTAGDGRRRPAVLLPAVPVDTVLAAGERGLLAACADHANGQLHLMAGPARAEDWQTISSLTERCVDAPAVAWLPGGAVLAWVRADAEGRIDLAVQQAAGRNTFVFSGDLQGHPTALDAAHHTPYPYLGIVCLPNDMDLPRGQTDATLTAGVTAALVKVRDFWTEATYGKVDITSEVHPEVVRLPSPMSTYMVRARPKIIDGYGVAFPVAFQGGETLVVDGTAGYSATVTFAAGSMQRDAIVAFVNQALDVVPFNGDPAEKPRAYHSDIGQLRIHTAGFVDPGTHLAVGGTAVGMLGFGLADVTVYEGSKTQEDHLELMLRDAVRAVANTKPDPAAYLRQFYGAVISLASNLGWYAIRANASFGPEQQPILENQPDSAIAYYYVTAPDTADTFAHETGHNLRLPDLYQEGPRYLGAEVGNWDLMDSSPFGHPTTWEKSYQSDADHPGSRWMEPQNVITLDETTGSVEVLLMPNETCFPQANPFAATHPGVPLCHALRIPLDANHAFYVENRQNGPFVDPGLGRVDFSQGLPGQGLLITDAVNDVGLTGLPRAPVILLCPEGAKIAHIPESILDDVAAAGTKAARLFILSPYVPAEIPQSVADKMAAAGSRDEIAGLLEEHQDRQVSALYPMNTLGKEVVLYQLPDGSGDIRVQILEIIGAVAPRVYRVRASWGQPGSWFDLEIREWVNPPPYESADIWIDSEENGWNTFEHHDAAANPSIAGNPVLNGDRPWIGHANRVYARVWNHGDRAQNNVRVDFEVMIPPGQHGGYPLGSDFVNIPAGGYALAEATWTPLAVPPDEHTCIVAKAEYRRWNLAAGIVGEQNADNNAAQENISDFYVGSGSQYEPVTVPFEFANPLPCRAEMKLRARGLTPGWTLTVDPYRFTLEARERMEGTATLAAADTVPIQDLDETPVPPVFSLEALVRVGCSWERVGGFSLAAHAVRKSALRMSADPGGAGIYVTGEASAGGVPVPNANVAVRIIAPNGDTLGVSRDTTNVDGEVTVLVPLDWNTLPGGITLGVEARLSPTRTFGPARALIQVHH